VHNSRLKNGGVLGGANEDARLEEGVIASCMDVSVSKDSSECDLGAVRGWRGREQAAESRRMELVWKEEKRRALGLVVSSHKSHRHKQDRKVMVAQLGGGGGQRRGRRRSDAEKEASAPRSGLYLPATAGHACPSPSRERSRPTGKDRSRPAKGRNRPTDLSPEESA
jgi:hypothetical protein